MSVVTLDRVDRRLLNLIQADFPLVSRPFAQLGDALGISEEEAMERTQALKRAHVIRQISAIFDTRALGYQSSLVAMRVPPERADEAAEVINAHPGVSHNYLRDHSFNIWFTIAVPPTSSIERTVERLRELAGAESTRLLPTLKLLKIGVQLNMTEEEDDAAPLPSAPRPEPQHSKLTEQDIQVIRALQEDLRIEPTPFQTMAEQLGMAEEDLFAHAQTLIASGRMRRFAAVLHHRDAGFAANGMVVWKVPEEQVTDVGLKMASFRAVSHCYQRPAYPDWPYTVFTMIHGHSQSDCERVAQAIAQATGVTEWRILYSTKEYKKMRVRYFTPEIDDWEHRFLGEAA